MAACGGEHTAVVGEDGRLWTWGEGSEGRLGHGDMKPRFEPTMVRTEGVHAKVLMVALGGLHSAAVLDDGSLLTWGYGEDGALGHPKPYRVGFRDFSEKETLTRPTPIASGRFGGELVAMVSCGLGFTACVTQNGSLYMWGLGHYGVLGLNDMRDCRLPTLVSSEMLGDRRVEMVSCGHFHTAVVLEDGGVYTWGFGGFGALGLGDKEIKTRPGHVTALGGIRVVMIAAGEAHTLAVASEGELYSWGNGERGRLGLGDETEHVLPRKVAAEHLGFERVVMAAAGVGHSACVVETGEMYTWGRWQALGHPEDGSQHDILIPTRISPQYLSHERICTVAAGRNHTVAVTRGGRVFSWGLGGEGRLGLGHESSRMVPESVQFQPHTTFMGRFRHLPAEHVLAFAMCAHPRLASTGCVFAGLLPELVQRIVEAASVRPEGWQEVAEGILRLMGGR